VLLAACQTGRADVSPQDLERAVEDFGNLLVSGSFILDALVIISDDTLDNDAEYQLLKKNTFDAIRDITPLLEFDALFTIIKAIHSPFNFSSDEEAAANLPLLDRDAFVELSNVIKENVNTQLGETLVTELRTAYQPLVALQEAAGRDIQRVSEDSTRVQAELDLLDVKMTVKKGISKLSRGLFGDNSKNEQKLKQKQEALSRDELLSVYYQLIQKGPLPPLAEFESVVNLATQYIIETGDDFAQMADPAQVSDEYLVIVKEFIRQETPAVLQSIGEMEAALDCIKDSISKIPPPSD